MGIIFFFLFSYVFGKYVEVVENFSAFTTYAYVGNGRNDVYSGKLFRFGKHDISDKRPWYNMDNVEYMSNNISKGSGRLTLSICQYEINYGNGKCDSTYLPFMPQISQVAAIGSLVGQTEYEGKLCDLYNATGTEELENWTMEWYMTTYVWTDKEGNAWTMKKRKDTYNELHYPHTLVSTSIRTYSDQQRIDFTDESNIQKYFTFDSAFCKDGPHDLIELKYCDW